MRKRSKIRVVAVLFLLAILMSGSVAFSVMVSGIYLALMVFTMLCLFVLLAAFAWFSKKKK
jgi:protein-S-isoprenylcysteine O-methyltransferase Ste14